MEQFRSEASLFAMNTYMTFTAFGENAQAALTDVKQMVQQSEGLWSVTDENSEIYRANHSNGQTIDISEETVDILSFMFEMAEKTDGALEPTIYPVLTEWGFTTDTKRIPSQGQIEKKLLIARCVAGLFTGLCAGAMLQRGCGVKQKVSG